MAKRTTTAQLIEHKLGRDLGQYVAEMQTRDLGWRRIAQQIREDTGVVVSHESLRSWFAKTAA
jgi:hypothetical protein